jgi:hypothetical protein
MSDARWLDIDDDIASVVKHFGNAVAIFHEGGFDAGSLEGHKAGMALMHAMQSGHTSAEAALRRILSILGEEQPSANDWRVKLIDRLAKKVTGAYARPALLSSDMARDLHETRRFRHRATHSYSEFEASLALQAILAAERLAASVPSALGSFRRIVDPAVPGEEGDRDGTGGGRAARDSGILRQRPPGRAQES